MKRKTLFFLSFMLISIFSINAQIFITEIADPNNEAGARFVELYNAGSSEVDLSTGWQLQRYTNGNAAPQSAVDLTGTISAGGFYVICNNGTTFNTIFGFDADQDIGTGGPADSNGDDQIQLLSPGAVVVDLFGVPGEDGSGTPHEFEDGRAERIASVTTGVQTWDENEWNIDNDSGGGDGAQDAPAGYDPGAWIGAPSSNDQTSTITVPGTQIPLGTISSIFSDSTSIFRFTVTDAGGDGLPTIITHMRFVAGPNNTLLFDENISGGTVFNVTDNSTNLISGEGDVGAAYVYVPVSITVAEGTSETFEAALYIDNDNVFDHGILQFQINSVSHGFTADASGSGFESTFTGGDIVGNNFTIDVVATQLSFSQQPTTVVKDVVMTPAVLVATTDAGGNVDVDYAATPITLGFTAGTMSGTNPQSTTAGVATFNDLSFDTEGTDVSLTANGGTFSEVTSNTFNITATAEGTLFFSEYIEGSSNNKAFEIFNPKSSAINLQNYRVSYANNGGGWSRFHVLPDFNLNSGDVYVISTDAADALILAQADEALAYPSVAHFSGDDAIALEVTADGGTSWTIIDIIGDPDLDPGTAWDVAGTTNGTKEHTIIRKYPTISTGNTNWGASAGTDVTDSEWVVYDQNDFSFIGWHGTPPNTPPVISDIGITPATPSPSDIVTVAATITDDAGVTVADLYWSLTTPVAIGDNSTAMVQGTGDVYTATIPAQTAGTTVYYMIGADDGSKVFVTSPEQSYVVSSPSGGGADCANAVTITPGTQHAVHTEEGDGNIYDQWFSFVATVSGTATVENCASDVDIYILIQKGMCGSDYDMADDNNCGGSGNSENFTFNITSGETYFIGIGNWDQATTAEYDWTLSVSDVTPVNSIALLRAGTVGNKYELTSEAVITYQQTYRGQRYIQDATAAVLIDDNGGIITTAYNQYDGITGLTGTLGEYNGMLQFIPEADPGSASSTGNTVTPQVITLSQFNSNFEDYEAELVTINGVTFADAGGTFVNGTVYSVSDASSKATANFRTNFYNVDYTDGIIPSISNITALCIEHSSGQTFTARDLADFYVLSNDASLSDLTSDLGTLNPAFETGTYNYTVSLPFGTTATPTVTATVTNVNAVANVVPASDVTSADAAERTTIVTVTAEDGTTTQDYLVEFNVASSINTINEKAISIYPNPSNGLFNIGLIESFNIEVLDIAGKVLQTKNANSNTTISIPDAGVYFIRFSNENGNIVKRVIVK